MAYIQYSPGIDIVSELNKSRGKFMLFYWLAAIAILVLFGFLVSWNYVWIIGVAAGILSTPIINIIQNKQYKKLAEKRKKLKK